MWNNKQQQIKNLIITLCKEEHIPVEKLHRLIGIKSPATFKRRLDEPQRFTQKEIERIAFILEFTESEKQLMREYKNAQS